MPLCQVCSSISLAALPDFPSQHYHETLSGRKYIHHFIKHQENAPNTAALNAVREQGQHHGSLEALRAAAADGCGLCILIEGEADALLEEIGSLGEEGRYSPPAFDMWLTKRPEEGQGFWVLSECSSSFANKKIMPIAAFTFVVDDDDALAPVIRGRPVQTFVDAPTLERVRRRLVECDNHHGECPKVPAGPVPKRLLDVQGSQSTGTVHLVQLPPDSREPYAALSYPFESRIIPTDPSRHAGAIPTSPLPKLLQDAIAATRALGIRYLWIDILCIPSAPWDRSSPEAAAVFSNAYTTISATGSLNPFDDGLFLPRPAPKCATMPYVAGGATGEARARVVPLAKLIGNARYVEMAGEPMTAGVWSFQERVLSARSVHFATDQVYVECMSQLVSEDGLRERKRYHNVLPTLPEGTLDSKGRSLNRSARSRWDALLWDYGRRAPGEQGDKLPALANIARAYQRLLADEGVDDEYIAGHWKSSLVETLPWQALKVRPGGDFRAPSWSWASHNCIPAMTLGRSPSHHALARISSTSVRHSSADVFGGIDSASVTLLAPPLIPLRLMTGEERGKARGCGGPTRLRSESGSENGVAAGLDTNDRRFAEAEEVVAKMELFALVLVETHREECAREHDPEGLLHGLLVTPAGDGTGMRRLGFFIAEPEDLGPASVFQTREEVVLV